MGLVARKMRQTRLNIIRNLRLISDENLMLEMEQAGFISHREKIAKLG